MAPTPCTSRKKCTMFSGRVSKGKWPRMTMRSKQWYTKVSRFPNSRANSSIGPLPPVRLVGIESMGQRAGGGQNPRLQKLRRVGAGAPHAFTARCQAGARKFQIFLGRFRDQLHLLLGSV